METRPRPLPTTANPPPSNFKPGSTPVHSQNINKCAISSQPFEGPGNHARPQADGILCVALAYINWNFMKRFKDSLY